MVKPSQQDSNEMTSAGEWSQRIGHHILADGHIAVPPRIAAWLENKAGVTDERRMAIRTSDPAAYAVLMALHLAALQHRSGGGTKLAGRQPVLQDLEMWLTTGEAAAQLGVTERAIRKWIAAEKLPATRRGGRWLINRNHLHALALFA